MSVTKHSEVRDLLNWSAGGDVLDYSTNVGNYFAGHCIPDPAQSHLHAVPEPLAGRCYSDFNYRDQDKEPENYQQWLDKAFGTTFPARSLMLIPVNIGRVIPQNWLLIG